MGNNDLPERSNTAQMPQREAGRKTNGDGKDGMARLGVGRDNAKRTSSEKNINDNTTAIGKYVMRIFSSNPRL